jgi:hypothetical protein
MEFVWDIPLIKTWIDSGTKFWDVEKIALLPLINPKGVSPTTKDPLEVWRIAPTCTFIIWGIVDISISPVDSLMLRLTEDGFVIILIF